MHGFKYLGFKSHALISQKNIYKSLVMCVLSVFQQTNLTNRRFLGIDQEEDFLTISKKRKQEIENRKTIATYRQKIGGFTDKNELELFLAEEPQTLYKSELNLNF